MKTEPLRILTRSIALLFAAASVHGATDLASVPLVTSSTSSVLPNILYVLDDSGSMDWDFLPDWACATYSVNNSSCGSTGEDPSSARAEYLFRNSTYNGVYYNPAITYTPPTFYNADGTANTTTYPSMTGQSSSTGGDATATSTARNWKAVANDGYGIQFTGTTDLGAANKYFYTFVAGEWCNSPSLLSCQSSSTGAFVYPATLRWCNSSSASTAATPATGPTISAYPGTNNCQALFNSTGGYGFTWARAPSPNLATVTVSGTSSTSVTSIKVNNLEILSADSPATASGNANTVAAAIASNINKCTAAATGRCQVSGYTAYASGGTVTIAAPLPANITYTPAIAKSGSMTVTTSAFAVGAVAGANLLTVITPDRDSYPYPGTTAKAGTRTDCAGTTCTYSEEMTNYANWWAYYRTRMQMMKTAASQSFASLGSNYRVGYLTINNNTSSDFLNLDTFNAANKRAWYLKFFNANPGSSTPLRVTLAKAGRLYAGKLNGTTLNGSTVADPMQYSCQQNFTILSTDGYWNESSTPKQVDNITSIGNQDGADIRPFNDGATITYNRSTSQLQYSQTQITLSTSQLQKRTTQLQQRTQQVRQRTVQYQTKTVQYQTRTVQNQSRTQQVQQQTQRFRKCSSGPPASYSGCTDINFDCSAGTNDATKPYCRVYSASVWTNVSSCTPTTGITPVTTCAGGNACSSSNPAVFCQTTDTGWVNVGTCNASSGGGQTVTCNVASDTGWQNSGTCSASNPSSGPTVTCKTLSDSGWQNSGACSASNPPSGPTVSCNTLSDSGWLNVASCAASDSATGPTVTCDLTDTGFVNASSCSPSSSGGQTVTCQTTDSGWQPVGACSASSSGGQTVTCQSAATGPTAVASCGACTITSPATSCTQTASSGNNYTQSTCNLTTIAPAVGVASCTADPASAANGYVSTNCNTVTTGPTSTSTCTAATAASSNNYTTTTCTVASTTGGTSNTLADVAEYYYTTDLRTSTLGNCTGAAVAPATTGNDVCSNDVPTSGQDAASWQHMTTFTLGLGASGLMQFSPSYATATSGDYFSVKNGASANPINGVCSWQASGTCNWPTPTSNTQTTIDDLWHAAVNGRGTYFSASNPASLVTGLSNALAGVSARLGAAAAATTSNPNVTSGDNFVFSSTFTTQQWDGQLYRQQIDLTTGVVPTFDVNNTATYDWAAQGQLDANTSRTVYTYSPSATNKLKAFAWANLTTTEQAYFTTPNISTLSQFCSSGVTCLSAASQTAAAGANLVAYLTGDRSNEGAATDTGKYYRQRTHLLGDIVNAEAVYVKASLYQYADANYLATTDGSTPFATTNNSRQGMVYAAANDGMLHAFNAATGAEMWAYVPSLILPQLYKLADKNYQSLHQYFVDGTPVAGDICPNAPASACTAAQWRTILVGGLNRGGRGYYALDITDPATPKALWEFTDANMGYTYGNPIITKLADGTWVVLVTSGYNNIPVDGYSTGDGIGRLYVLNASTGALIRTISTNAGDTGTSTGPSGLARINAWVDNASTNNTALRVYGGDLLGNLWRFDINDNVGAAGYEAERLTTFYSNAAGTTRQPITTKPELGDVGGVAVVFVGTGRYLGASDLSDTSLQSFYAVKDRLGNAALTPFSNPRSSGSGFVQQIETSGTCPTGTPSTICTTGQSVRSSSANVVNFASDNGWFLDLPDGGERATTDPTLALGTLGFTTNVPNVSACTAGGYSYRYFLDYRTGAAVSTSTTHVVAVRLGNALATRGVFVRLPNNTVVQLTRMSDGTTVTSNVPIGSGAGTTRRVSWRELINE